MKKGREREILGEMRGEWRGREDVSEVYEKG